jgi:hypothetical protein
MSRTSKRGGRKSKVIPVGHAARGKGNRKPPKFRYPMRTKYHRG